ncbi:DUF3604 domain-containing protein [Haliea sp. E17]|uniref:DUF3604 domain-containing protein n=1 Tax=Haliea sp. E17 TaxID=3401576 RepID=UPI003AAD1448
MSAIHEELPTRTALRRAMKQLIHHGRTLVAVLVVGIPAASSWALAAGEERADYSPYVGRNYPDNLYWGDAHVHTALSFDASLNGTSRVGPEETYRLARGETITGNLGEPVRLGRALDFLVVADHAEFLGVYPAVFNEDPRIMSQPDGSRWLSILRQVRENFANAQKLLVQLYRPPAGVPPLDQSGIMADAWRQTMEAAERFNEPGKFTAFIGYEWTGMARGDNLHRIVVFRDAQETVSRVRPFTMADSARPEDLWQYLQGYEDSTGGEVLAIPHNGNLSNGRMFASADSDGNPFSPEYARTRARWEPLYEATQIKGDAETHPLLSPDDPYADFETMDFGNLQNMPKQPEMLQYEYARSALKQGLVHAGQLGTNPFKLGLIGSSDTHTGMPAVRENNFMGKFGDDEPSAQRAQAMWDIFGISKANFSASGYTGVWARENTREAIFAAMERREVYATTGSRMAVRFFGGWSFAPGDELSPDFAANGYARGVPMGGDLHDAPAGSAPAFLIVAGKDPDGANLERLQVVKGWLDDSGQPQERVYDVALSGQRAVVEGKIAPAVASTVDTRTATWSNSVGSVQLGAVWRDPDFDPGQRAFYYTRVLEIPTPRWTTYDSAFYGTPLPTDVPAVIQERAYTSPIWYTP